MLLLGHHILTRCSCVEHDEGPLVSQPPCGCSLFYIDGHLMNKNDLC